MRCLILGVLTVLLAAPLSTAQMIDDLKTEERIKEGLKLGVDNNTLRLIPDNLRKQAEEVYGVIQNKVMPQAEVYKNSMDIDNNTGLLIFNDLPQAEIKEVEKDDAKTVGILSLTERFYIFISSSMPLSLLERYNKDIDAFGLGDNVVFVLRGCVPSGGLAGCGDFQKTLDFTRSFIMDTGNAGNGGLWIDPILFGKYEITEVPAFVYAKNVLLADDMGSEGDFSHLKGIPSWWMSVGDWALDYHLKELYQKSQSETLKRFK